MTYQAEFQSNRYVQTATQVGHSYRKPAEWMYATAATLLEANTKREAQKGKPMSIDHLKQMAVGLARRVPLED